MSVEFAFGIYTKPQKFTTLVKLYCMIYTYILAPNLYCDLLKNEDFYFFSPVPDTVLAPRMCSVSVSD